MSEYKKIEDAKCELTVTLEGESYKKAQDSAFRKLASKLEIKGFRKGQAPKNLVEKYISKNEILIEAAESLAQEALNNAVEEHNVTLIDRPELKIDEMSEEKCVLTFSCPCVPEIKLGDYKNLGYKVEECKVEDKEVDEEITNLLDRKADLELKEDGTVEDGDTAVIDFEGFLEGVPFDGGKGENFDLVIGSNSFIPGFEPQLIGMKPEETKEINVTFPADYQAENLKGKETTFKVTVHEIKKKVLPVLNDDFVKELKYENVNTVDELKNYTKENILKRKEADATNKAENDLMDKLAGIVEVNVPEQMIKSETENMLLNYEQRLAQQGINMEQFMKITSQTKEQLQDSMKEDAIKRIKINLALQKISKEEKLEVTAEDVESEYTKMAEMYQMSVDDIKKYIPDTNLKEDLKLQKALEILKK